MELDIDFAITAKYSDYHDSYARNLKVFKSFIKVFDSYFKKEKYQDSEIKIDEDANDRATIKFCAKKYQLGMRLDPADLNSACIKLIRLNRDRAFKIAEAVIDKGENIIFPDNLRVSLKDSYEFNNAVLDFFISHITRSADGKITAR